MPSESTENSITKQARPQASNPPSSKQLTARLKALNLSSSKQPAGRLQASNPSSSEQLAASTTRQCPAQQPTPADDTTNHGHDWRGKTVMEMFPHPDDNTDGYDTDELENHYLGLRDREAYLKRCGDTDPTEWFNEQARLAWAEEDCI